MVESYSRNERVKGELDFGARKDAIPDEIDLLVLGGYTINYIRKLVTLVKEHTVWTLILPYLAPIQRHVLVEETIGRKENMKDVIRFLQDPYLFLQDVELRICILYMEMAAYLTGSRKKLQKAVILKKQMISP